MTEDCNRFLSVVKTDKEGNRLNAVKVDGVDSTDEKVIGKRLQEIAKNATTGGLYKPVGELYGFPIKVHTHLCAAIRSRPSVLKSRNRNTWFRLLRARSYAIKSVIR